VLRKIDSWPLQNVLEEIDRRWRVIDDRAWFLACRVEEKAVKDRVAKTAARARGYEVFIKRCPKIRQKNVYKK